MQNWIPIRHLYSAVGKSKCSENRNEMGVTPTRPFYSAGKSKAFGVGHLYSAVWKSKPLGGDRNELGLTPNSAFPLCSEIRLVTPRSDWSALRFDWFTPLWNLTSQLWGLIGPLRGLISPLCPLPTPRLTREQPVKGEEIIKAIIGFRNLTTASSKWD